MNIKNKFLLMPLFLFAFSSVAMREEDSTFEDDEKLQRKALVTGEPSSIQKNPYEEDVYAEFLPKDKLEIFDVETKKLKQILIDVGAGSDSVDGYLSYETNQTELLKSYKQTQPTGLRLGFFVAAHRFNKINKFLVGRKSTLKRLSFSGKRRFAKAHTANKKLLKDFKKNNLEALKKWRESIEHISEQVLKIEINNPAVTNLNMRLILEKQQASVAETFWNHDWSDSQKKLFSLYRAFWQMDELINSFSSAGKDKRIQIPIDQIMPEDKPEKKKRSARKKS